MLVAEVLKQNPLNEEDKNKLLEFNKTLSNPFGVDISVQYTTFQDYGCSSKKES